MLEGEAVFHQPLRLRDNVELFLQSAPGVDLGNSPDLAQLRLDHPILNLAQFGERPIDVVRADHIVEDLAQSCRDRPELGHRDALRQLNGLQAFGDELPRAEDARGVIEGGYNL